MNIFGWLLVALKLGKSPKRKTLILHRDGTVSAWCDTRWIRVRSFYSGPLSAADRKRIERSKAHRHLLQPDPLAEVDAVSAKLKAEGVEVNEWLKRQREEEDWENS
jgi:hypothetical protein